MNAPYQLPSQSATASRCLDPKWTGTEADRRDMKTLKLDQVVKVSPSNALLSLLSPPGLLTASPAQFWYTCHFRLLLDINFAPGKPSLCRLIPLSNDILLATNTKPLSSALSVSLSNGGTAGLFWNYIIAAFGLGLVYASIAELSSMCVFSPQLLYLVFVLLCSSPLLR